MLSQFNDESSASLSVDPLAPSHVVLGLLDHPLHLGHQTFCPTSVNVSVVHHEVGVEDLPDNNFVVLDNRLLGDRVEGTKDCAVGKTYLS